MAGINALSSLGPAGDRAHQRQQLMIFTFASNTCSALLIIVVPLLTSHDFSTNAHKLTTEFIHLKRAPSLRIY